MEDFVAAKKEHKVQVIARDVRYIAVERDGRVTFSKDGDPLGGAKWLDDQFQDSTAMLPDDVAHALERKIKEAIDADYFD